MITKPLLYALACTVLAGGLTACSTAPEASAPAAIAVASAKPQRIKEVQVIQHVTCDPEQAKKLQAEINAREAAQRAAGMPMADDYLKNYKPSAEATQG